METILIITTLLALIGAYLNSLAKKEGFILWILTNTVFMTHNYVIGQWQQSILFAFYLLISFYGLYNKLKEEKKLT